MALELAYGADFMCPVVDPDPLWGGGVGAGVAGTSLAENPPKPTRAKLRMLPGCGA
jgi:hypothetical protein